MCRAGNHKKTSCSHRILNLRQIWGRTPIVRHPIAWTPWAKNMPEVQVGSENPCIPIHGKTFDVTDLDYIDMVDSTSDQ